MSIRQMFNQPANVKVMFNIGATMDIPTGSFLKGAHGEHILLGGLGMLTGVTGTGNTFKSTIMHYMMLSAADRLSSTAETSMSTYDTEINIHEDRLRYLTKQFDSFKDKDIIDEGGWVITDKTMYHGDQWFQKLQEYCKEKKSLGKKIEYDTPFLSRDKVTPLRIMIPTFSEVDSLTEFETSDVAEIQDKHALGDSGGNTIHMRQGLAKMRFLMEAPLLAAAHNHFFLLTAHLGKEISMASGPYAPQPTKKLQNMKIGDKIKGVTDKFFFLTSNFWQMLSCSSLKNQATKGPEYPRDSDDNTAGDKDLNIVTMLQLRSKSGPSGEVLDVIVSQRDGVLPSLTEFHYIKTADRFGISGTLQHYNLDLYPDVKLGRTTVRSKIDNDPKLRRALNITSELCQMHEYYRYMREDLCTPKDIYEYLTTNGFDLDWILSNTRGWWTVNNDSHPLLFLSTYDLCLMVKGEYFPYWMNEDKTIKKEYIKS